MPVSTDTALALDPGSSSREEQPAVSPQAFAVSLQPLHLLLASLRRRGARGTWRRLVRRVKMRHETRLRREADRAFDRARGVETASWVHPPSLDTDSPNRRHAVRYAPSKVEDVRRLLGKLDLPYTGATFVDYGSGKGRVLLIAAEYPFRRIVGVEFAASLDEIARRNVATLGDDARRVETLVVDAVDYEPPPTPLVLYFNNPFDASVLQRVLARLERSLAATPRAVRLLYHGPPESGALIEDAGFVPVDVDRLPWLVRGMWAAPAARHENGAARSI